MMAVNVPEPVTLNEDDPFERILVDLVKTNRVKGMQYGDAEGDPFNNFYENALATGLSPRQVCEVLLQKHQGQIKKYFMSGAHTPGVDDAMIDRAVYAIISIELYRRELYV